MSDFHLALEHLQDTHDAEIFSLNTLNSDLRRRNGDLATFSATQAQLIVQQRAEIARLKARLPHGTSP